MRSMGWVIVVLASHAYAAPDLAPPAPEHQVTATKPSLPPVPAFEIPVAPAGTHGVLELMVLGKPLLDSELQVSGYVTWLYDCVEAVRKPKETRAKTQKRIDADPTMCERAKFYVGDTKDTTPEQSLWVVDVPRPYNKLEIERIAKADRTPQQYPDRCDPDPKRKGPFCVALAVGDYVTVTGTYAVASPHAERNSDGLLVVKTIATGTAPTTVTKKEATFTATPVPPLAVPKAVARPPASEALRLSSVKHSNEGTRAYAQRNYALAESEYTQAAKDWAGNHVALYGLAGAYIGTANWRGASAAMAKAFELLPTNAMYAMIYGYTLYESAIAEAREAMAKRQNMPPAAVQPDLTGVNFSKAEQYLRYAVKLDDQLWRAHYYLGRIARDQGRAREAAESLTKAVSSLPSAPGPYVALAEIYRKWQRPDLALLIAAQGALVASPASDVWYELGMSNDDLRRDEPAIEAFTKALDADAANTKALFQRGQALFRAARFVDARRDLEAFTKTASPGTDFARVQANKMLMDIAAKAKRP